MEIVFKQEGGIAAFPGLSRPTIIDTEQLPSDEADALTQLVADAHFFSLPPAPKTYPKAADIHTYTISITDGSRHHQVKLVDPVRNADLVALIDALKGYSKARR